MGVGAMTDFGSLLANPKTLMLGAAAQVGIFATVLGAVLLSSFGIVEFNLAEAAAIGIIGGADGPTAIYVASLLAPHLLGAIGVGASDSAAHHAFTDNPGRAGNQNATIASRLTAGKNCLSAGAADSGRHFPAFCGALIGDVLFR